MGLYLSQRLGRGTYLHAPVGPLFVLGMLWLRFMLGFAILALRLAAYLVRDVASAIGTIEGARRRWPASGYRRAIAYQLVREVVRVTPEAVRREGLAVWAIYGVGDHFRVGRYPADERRFARLYPQHSGNLARVGLYPTAASARRAATGLTRNEFTVNELRRVFRGK
jgi:hypothetical protein